MGLMIVRFVYIANVSSVCVSRGGGDGGEGRFSWYFSSPTEHSGYGKFRVRSREL